jgi:hypothetical protein
MKRVRQKMQINNNLIEINKSETKLHVTTTLIDT